MLDVCIAEAFKTLAKMYHKKSGIFPHSVSYMNACDRLRREVHLPVQAAKKSKRVVTFHDIQTSRDIVIGVDRFFETAHKKQKNVGVIDLLILSTAKYLIDFFGFSRDSIFIVTMDGPLYELGRTYAELPSVFNPDNQADHPSKVFV